MANPIGRPRVYKEEYCEKIIEHMANGLSCETFAGAIGVSKDTLYRWFKEYPEFSDAKAIGVEQSRLYWERIGIAGMLGQEIEINGKKQHLYLNASLWIFNMKNRFKWADRQVVEGDADAPAIKLAYNLKDDDK